MMMCHDATSRDREYYVFGSVEKSTVTFESNVVSGRLMPFGALACATQWLVLRGAHRLSLCHTMVCLHNDFTLLQGRHVSGRQIPKKGMSPGQAPSPGRQISQTGTSPRQGRHDPKAGMFLGPRAGLWGRHVTRQARCSIAPRPYRPVS
jgi:hypothetical protein